MGMYEEKHRLYAAYIAEMNWRGHSPELPSEEVRRRCDGLISSKACSWHNVYASDGELAGFLLIGKGAPYLLPGSVRTVVAAYVKPGLRRHGLLSGVLRNYMDRHPGVYGLAEEGRSGAWEAMRGVFRKCGYAPAGGSGAFFKPTGKEA